jgi:hypothetical protein
VQLDGVLAERKIYASTMPMDYLDAAAGFVRLQLAAMQLRRAYMTLVVGSEAALAVRFPCWEG